MRKLNRPSRNRPARANSKGSRRSSARVRLLPQSSRDESVVRPKGKLVIIGGREDKSGRMEILNEVARLGNYGKLVVASIASEMPKDLWDDYRAVFKKLGIKKFDHLFIDRPEEARSEKATKVLDDASIVFFTGGDQLKITTKIGGTAVADRLFQIYRDGGVIAGTSAGASMMGETMLVGGENQESHKVGNWMMAPGLGLMKETIIDQHFAQRGRIGRLLGAVALNPGILGIGIDEDTAIILEGSSFRVCGSNAVYVIDGRGVSYTNISEAEADRTMSMHDVRLHILSTGEDYDLVTRRPNAKVVTEAT